MSTESPQLYNKQDGSLQTLLKHPAYADRFKQVLGERAPQFMSSILSLGATMRDVEPKSIIAAAMTAAALDLPIDRNLGFAWIVPYKSNNVKLAQFQMGYRGYVQLALRTGRYARLNACEVFEGELVKWDRLTGDLVLDSTKRKSPVVVGYASFLRLTTGYEHSDYWTVEEVKEHAQQYSQAYRSALKYNDKDAAWIKNFGEMAMKTVLSLHVRKWGPMSVQINKAVVEDQGARINIDADVVYPDNNDAPPEDKKDRKPKKALEAPPTVDDRPVDDDQVPGAEVPAAEATATGPVEPLPNLDKPFEVVAQFCARDGVTEAQVFGHMRNLRWTKKDQTQLNELAASKVRDIAANWPDHIEKIRAIQVA